MLARGWLAYPVTSMHAHLPPKSGCINVIPRFALSRRRATALFRNPVRKAQRSVPGFSSTPTSACRRYATSPPSAVPLTSSAIHRIAPSSAIHRIAPLVAMHHRHRRKTAEERFHTLARGWLAYPVTPSIRILMLTSPNFQLVRSRLRTSPVLTGRRANITLAIRSRLRHIRQGTFADGAGWNHAPHT